MAPNIIISSIGFFTILLPPNSDKINMAVTVLLGFFFIQTITADQFPKVKDSPLLAHYTLFALILSTLNLIGSVILVSIERISIVPLPFFFRVLKYLSIIMLYQYEGNELNITAIKNARHKKNKEESNAQIEINPLQQNSEQENSNRVKKVESVIDSDEIHNFWHNFEFCLNRLFSILYLIASTAIMLAFLLPLFLA